MYEKSHSRRDYLLLDALPGATAIINQEGEIIASNKAWDNDGSCLNWFGIEKRERNYFDQCKTAVEQGFESAIRLIFKLRDIIEGKKQRDELILSVKNSGVRWCKVILSRYSASPVQILVMFEDITAQMNTYNGYRDHEERYSHHFKHSVSGIILGTPDGGIIDANPAACHMLGYSREELLAGGRSLIVDVNDPLHIEMMRTRGENLQFEGEKVYLHKNGYPIPVEITSVLYRQGDNEWCVLNTFRDKTNEKQAQEALDRERRFTQTALNSVPGLFLVLDSGLNLVRWNQSFLYETGLHEEQLSSFSISSLFSKEDQVWTEKVLQQIIHTGKGSFLAKVITTYNGTRYYNFFVNSFDSIEETFLVVTAIDITDLRVSESEREKNICLLNQLFDNSPLPMVMVNAKGVIRKVNRGFQTLFEYKEDELVGNKLNGLITSEKNREEAISFSNETLHGTVNQSQTNRYSKSGKEIPVLISAFPVFHHDEVIAAYGIYVDLRKQKELEYNLQKSLNEKEVLLQEVHHRVKNNLAIISGLIELQIIHECNPLVQQKLKETQNRILSIAKIHENLYKHQNLIEVRFNQYLKSILESLPETISSVSFVESQADETPLLNLNQAVPLGLVINELIHFNRERVTQVLPVSISFSKNGSNIISVKIKGLSFSNEAMSMADSREASFKRLLIDTLMSQLDAQIEYPNNGNDLIVITFKNDRYLRGAGNSLN